MLAVPKLLLAAGLLAPVLHHGWADYDTDRAFTLEGTIRKVQYINPHVLIDVRPSDDTTKRWLSVLAPPSRMTRRGLPQDSVRVGQTARLYGYPHKEHGGEMRAERITIGGRTTELR
jgi:Family of unknown function (DUF6152)